jgi:sporulation protein YlmC with PRC-barrel domain
MDIPINAKVLDADEKECGRVSYIVLNPVTEQLTHIVVDRGTWPHDERLVPIEQVQRNLNSHISLLCTKDELAKMDSFMETEFVTADIPRYLSDPYVLVQPFRYADVEQVIVEHEHVPEGETAVHRGARVEATDGHVGRVDEFLIDPASERITHLVLREGHLWGKKEISVPISYIRTFEEDTVYLNLDKDGIEALPVIPAR